MKNSYGNKFYNSIAIDTLRVGLTGGWRGAAIGAISGAAGGAVSGLIIGSGGGFMVNIVGSGVGGATTNAVDAVLNGRTPSPTRVVISGILSSFAIGASRVENTIVIEAFSAALGVMADATLLSVELMNKISKWRQDAIDQVVISYNNGFITIVGKSRDGCEVINETIKFDKSSQDPEIPEIVGIRQWAKLV